MKDVIYFQPPGINKKYCEAGMMLDHDNDYIYYLHEPCKILKSEVTIIPKENVVVKDIYTIEVKK